MNKSAYPVHKTKIIPVFLPNRGCANRCIFCNQREVIGSEAISTPQEVYPLIRRYLETIRRRSRARRQQQVEVAFYGGNFTGLSLDEQQRFLEPAARAVREGRINGLRISTRPDYLSRGGLKFLSGYRVRTIEIGVQSLEKLVLQKSGRTYSEKEVVEAMNLLHEGRFFIGLHLMLGLPGESFEGLSRTVEKVIQMAPHFVRIHPTLVIRGTELERMYQEGEYTPFSLEQAVETCKQVARRLIEAGIPVARIGLQSTPDMGVVAGPFHPALGELVASAMAYERMQELLARQVSATQATTQTAEGQPWVVIWVPERELSIFIGQHQQNLRRLQQRYHKISILPDKNLGAGKVRCMAGNFSIA